MFVKNLLKYILTKNLSSYRGVYELNTELKEEIKKFFKIQYLNYLGPGFTFYDKCFLLYETDKGKFGIGFFYNYLMLSFVKEIPDGRFNFVYMDRSAGLEFNGINTILIKSIRSEDTIKTVFEGKAFNFDKEIVALKLEGYEF